MATDPIDDLMTHPTGDSAADPWQKYCTFCSQRYPNFRSFCLVCHKTLIWLSPQRPIQQTLFDVPPPPDPWWSVEWCWAMNDDEKESETSPSGWQTHRTWTRMRDKRRADNAVRRLRRSFPGKRFRVVAVD
jgi:hypothetical protein